MGNHCCGLSRIRPQSQQQGRSGSDAARYNSRGDSVETRDTLSESLPQAAAQGSKHLLDFIAAPGNAELAAWVAGLDVPTIK